MVAKYPKQLRFKWYLWVEKHNKPVTDTCQLFGVSRKIYCYRYSRDHGNRSPHYCSPRAHPNTKLTPEVKKFIDKEKLKTNYGPLKMKLSVERNLGLKISPTIIYRYYLKKNLIRKPQKKLPWYEPMKERLIVVRLGQGVQADIKYVYENNGLTPQKNWKNTIRIIYQKWCQES